MEQERSGIAAENADDRLASLLHAGARVAQKAVAGFPAGDGSEEIQIRA